MSQVVWRRPGVVLGALALVAFMVPFALGRWLFPLGSINRDEPMYMFSAKLLRTGHLTLPDSFAPFRPWASGIHGGRLVLKYTPVWPGVLAAGELLGSMRIGVAVVSAIAVVLTGLLGREVFGRWTEGLLAAAVLLLSPLFFFQTGTFLSYLFQLVLELAIMLLAVGALRRWPADGTAVRGVRGRLVAGGAIWGVAAFARPYDALLLAVPLILAAVAIGWREPRRLCAWIGWSAAGRGGAAWRAAGLQLGSPGEPAQEQLHDHRAVRRARLRSPGRDPDVLVRIHRARRVPVVHPQPLAVAEWTFGGFVLVALAGLGLWRSRGRGAAVWAVAGVGVSFALGYAFFWSPYSIAALWPGTRTLGPFYHLALLIPLTLFGAAGLAAVFERSRIATAVIVTIMVVATAGGVVTKVQRNLPITRQYRSTNHLVERAHVGKAVLFMDDRGSNGFGTAAPFLENRPELDQRVVYTNRKRSCRPARHPRAPREDAVPTQVGDSTRRRAAGPHSLRRATPRPHGEPRCGFAFAS